MKNFFLILTSISFLVSCDNPKKYEGKWTHNELKISGSKHDLPFRIVIENDSIKFNYWSFNHWHKYPLKIEKGRLDFNNWTLNAKIVKDTLCLNNIDYFIKDENDSILLNWWWKPITEINLPKLDHTNFSSNSYPIDGPNVHVLFGKKLDNGEYSLQLNDKHSSMNDLPAFAHYRSSYRGEEIRPFPTVVLYIDQTSPMKYIEDMFHNLAVVNQLKLSLINHIHLSFSDSLGLYYQYEKLKKRLPYIMEDDFYNSSTSKDGISNIPPPSPRPPFKMFEDAALESKFIYLKKDKLYCEDKTISPSELRNLVKPWVENNKVIFSLYDLESTYSKFLEMTAIINSVYQNVREKASKEKFNTSLKDLTREQLIEIKIEKPMNHVWSFSIPHFNHVIENNGSFFGLKVLYLDSVPSSE